ncbi:glycine-rich domain-containing protein [Kluyvera georgiana]|uniref:glycine-rich domain-containing protein n=1 Tax=Kluyvera georgiana TaxID=73098 RepID=UPI003F664B7B
MALTLLAANNAQTVLAAGISASATSLTVNSGTGSLFPAPSDGVSFFKLTLIDAATGQLTEIMHVTARTGDTMKIERGQEGTTARAWSANDIAANMMTAGTLSYILGSFQPLDATLTALAALIGSADKLAYFNGDDTAALTALTTVGRSVIGQTSIPNLLSYLGISSRSLVITSSQTVTSIPAWVTSIRVSACAGGGGGGSGASNNTGQSSLVGGGGGGGGGGGQSILRKTYTITAGQSLSVTIGSGGTGGTGVTTGPGTSGGNGGTTSIAGLFTLTGGTGGDNGGAVTSNSLGNGGPGGIGGLGYPAGSCGGDGNYAGNGGAGASTAFGGGGGGARAVKTNPSEPRFQGQPAFGYGSGGGGSGGAYGASTALSSYAGGNGAPGIVIIEW